MAGGCRLPSRSNPCEGEGAERGWLACHVSGGLRGPKVLIEQSLALGRKLEDKESIASSLAHLCGVAMLGQHDDTPVMTVLEEAMRLKPELKDRRTVGNLLILEGRVALARGDLQRSVALGEESLALYREAEDDYGVVMCLLHIGYITLRLDEAHGVHVTSGGAGTKVPENPGS